MYNTYMTATHYEDSIQTQQNNIYGSLYLIRYKPIWKTAFVSLFFFLVLQPLVGQGILIH
jgi:hypothetical protein